MRKNRKLLKLLLAVSLTAMSVVIDVLCKLYITSDTFNLPYYAIPLILGSIMLGSGYGMMMALVGDALGVVLGGLTYMPLYSLAAVSWGAIPGLISRKYSLTKVAFAIVLAYIFANLSNTFANYFYWGSTVAMTTLLLRIATIPLNSILLIVVTHILYKRLYVIFPEYMMIRKVNNAQ